MRARRRPPKGKHDGNHEVISRTLVAVGCTVVDISALGEGAPDLLVGRRGQTYLLEVKRPWVPGTGMSRKDIALRENQVKWHREWRGHPVAVVDSPEGAVRAVGAA